MISFLKPLNIGGLQLASNIILAPMAGITNRSFRLICRRYGASLCFTEMVSVNGLVRNGKKSYELIKNYENDSPIGVQLFGSDPETLAEGGRRAESSADLIDINMGCPVRKVVGTGAGSSILKDLKLATRIIRSVRRSTTLPLSVKIRSGWDAENINFLEIGKIAENEGCDAITLHPRTRTQMFNGKAEWESITKLKQHLKIPVIASGDIFAAKDVTDVLSLTGCDGVMIARGAMGNPWIFRDVSKLNSGVPVTPPDKKERLEIALLHFELLSEESGEDVATREMRKHFSWYVKGLQGASHFRDSVNRCTSKLDMLAEVNRFLG